MGILSDLADLYPSTVLLATPDGTFDSRGNPNFGADVSYSAQIEPSGGKVVRRHDSHAEVVSKYRIFLYSATAINPISRITLPSGYAPTQPPILESNSFTDEDGAHHVELMV